MWFNFVKIISSVLCIYKFWTIYRKFRGIWSMFWEIFSFISVFICSVEFNLVLGVVWVNVLSWLNGCMKWYEFFRSNYSVCLMFRVIFLNFLLFEYWVVDLLANHVLFAIGNNYHLLYEDSVVLLWSWSCYFVEYGVRDVN